MNRYSLCWRNYRLELGERTAVMGVLNITPDSFSDGGRFFRLEDALDRAGEMVEQGADIIDIGGESTRPFSEPVSAQEELARVLPAIERLSGQIDVPISIDTTKAEVAQRAVDAGASIINDVSALRFDPEMGRVAAETGALLVVMHMKGSPRTMQVNPQYDDLIGEIRDFLERAIDRAVAAGVDRARIIADPGIGFGKTVFHNLQLIDELDSLSNLGVPLMLGPSRKAFIRKVLADVHGRELPPDRPEIEAGTQAAVAAGVMKGAHIVRVHNVADTRATVGLIDAIRNRRNNSERRS